ncbi:hypothetical protein SM124_09805 [Bacillus sp. 31A1R]|uniref:Uncharacterized protein n=1 Tax=Robertmurraya mangrovi TaxID=3098077 RepID=A0ABU5IY02_9BACI|nr:hypothetical protein [Bacillus sp. 31A1R]MDZ5472040.1 hypothetical protein [Bacillus sp. 31A1R]
MNGMDLHKIEIMRDGNWEEVPYESLDVGDQFRMIDPEGNIFVDSYGEVMSAASKPFFDEDLGTWLVQIK